MNGPNINMPGVREPDIYGKQDYKALCQLVRDTGAELGDEVELFRATTRARWLTAFRRRSERAMP